MIPAPPHLDFEAWKDQIRKMGGRFDPKVIDPKAFAGWVRPISAYGLIAAEVGSNAVVVERTQRGVRVDGGLPATFFAGNAGESWNTMALVLPRQALVSHLGFEPRGGLHRRNGTVVGRLLLDLIRNAGEEEVPPSRIECYVRLAVHDLVGALFAPGDPAPARHSDKLFMRVRGVIKDGFVDPDLDPSEVATRAGISLRYLQKLFTERRSTCSEFIYSFRLDYAAHLLQRQSALGASQALRAIAYASGFRDYSHFARRFRQRFGHAPGAHSAGESCDRKGALNACG